MIRPATELDIPQMFDLLMRYYDEYKFVQRSGVSLNADAAVAMIKHHIPQIALINEVDGKVTGMVFGVTSAWPGNWHVQVAQETCCFGDNEEVLRIAFDAEAKKRRCRVSMISCFTRSSLDRFRKLV